MKILLTGCAGFIGSHLLDRLLSEGHEVVGIDCLDANYAEQIKRTNIAKHLLKPQQNSSFKFIQSNLDVETTYAKLRSQKLTNFDCILHLASTTNLHGYDEAEEDHTSNINITLRLLEFAREEEIPQFIFASSIRVYGRNSKVPWSETLENLQPVNSSDSIKYYCEQLGRVYSANYPIRFLALRLATTYGPRQPPTMALHTFAQNIRDGSTILLNGDGYTRRDYVYIDDVVDGFIAALNYKSSAYEVINLGGNQALELYDLIAQLEVCLNLQADIEQLPRTQQELDITHASTEKATQLLHYHPKVSFEDGVQHFAEWFINTNHTNTPLTS
ncbi:NAD-dependent epimerase/dehydratase family protein [Coraliomargarita algicola]|uniref:NAD-dependent epimerase/dehydratase family protein n=1 Tax=Coraliomargarita algicola TaxID=3092156 RepID=A0ABZ0RPA8_9BACT|nr:NAD-dependent epimerase/dehydratase family protein [Coraliomargarita sp. J2-16]WPJ97362.1 NAD-dependent epimerase/dehydratase family protein [Coraliomargarita sp. J2-16]